MKRIYILGILLIGLSFQAEAQDERSGILEKHEQSIGIATGIDYAIAPLQLTYKRGFNIFDYTFPVTLGADVTVPVFAVDLNDIRMRIISEATILRKRNFEVRGGIDPVFVNLKMETESMASLGTDFHVFTGFVNSKWNTGLEINYNQVFSTHITHTDTYKENVFADVADGWYKNTASNLRIGLMVNRRIKKIDIYFDGGLSKTGKFNDYLFVPSIYTHIGVNYRFH